jgi:hypothetical protein
VVVDDLDFVCVSIRPSEADPPLVVDPDAVLSSAIAFEGLEPISWRRHQVAERLSAVQIEQFAARRALNRSKAGNRSIVEQGLGIARPEGLYHPRRVLRGS